MQFESQQFTKQTNVNNFLSTILETTYGMDCLYAVDKCQTVEFSFTFERSMVSVIYVHTVPKPGNKDSSLPYRYQECS